MIPVLILAGIVAVAVFTYAAGVASDEMCQCPYECGEHAAEYPEP